MRFKPQSWLLPLSIPYQATVQLRNRLYDLDIIAAQSVNVPVISVGNISVGGTGKTPFVLLLLELLHNLNLPPKGKIAVVSRGYGGLARKTTMVSDGKCILETADFVGDEPVMIAESAPESIVIVDHRKVRGAKYAVQEQKAKAIILDDGFQHRRLNRDLDIVLLDGENPLGSGRLLPAGFLREPASSLSRADIVVLSNPRGPEEELSARAEKLEALLGKPVIVTLNAPQYWKRAGHNELLGLDQGKDRRVMAFTGIANPRSFFQSVSAQGVELVQETALPDHCRYTKLEIDKISRFFTSLKAEWLVTTAKDGVKLPQLFCLLPVYQLIMKTRILFGQESVEKWLVGLFSKTGK